MRKIKLTVLLVNGLCYRVYIMGIEALALWVITGNGQWAFKASVTINIISLFAYWFYHYWFAKLIQMGK